MKSNDVTVVISNKRKECYSLVLGVYIKCGTIYVLAVVF